MRTLELKALDGPDGFAPGEAPDPAPQDGDVLIEVRAAGVSFPDLLVSKGAYQVAPELPFIAGMEVAGIVRSAPEGAAVQAGQRVWSAPGERGFAELVSTPVGRVFALPDEMSFEEGAAIPSNFLTAVFALGRRGNLRSGETLLVLGAAGGLGSACVTIGKAMGARVIAAVSVEGKRETARLAGADEVVVGEAFRDEALALTDGRGVDVVADIVGGEMTLQAVRSTAAQGRVLILGFTSGIAEIKVNRLLLRNISLVGAGLGAFESALPDIVFQTGVELNELLARGARPIIDRTYPLAEGADALRRLEAREALGKLVLTV
jgi:NADPH2:quinone reductase